MIICGTDFSETASHALDRALRMGSLLRRDVLVVHVEAFPRPRPLRASDEEAIWLQRAGLDLPDVVFRQGTPWVELVRAAMQTDAEMVVVGTHGCTGFQPVALGSTATRLALLSPRPVLLVGARERASTSFATRPPAAQGAVTVSRTPARPPARGEGPWLHASPGGDPR